jgi:hypothetical protein
MRFHYWPAIPRFQAPLRLPLLPPLMLSAFRYALFISITPLLRYAIDTISLSFSLLYADIIFTLITPLHFADAIIFTLLRHYCHTLMPLFRFRLFR